MLTYSLASNAARRADFHKLAELKDPHPQRPVLVRIDSRFEQPSNGQARRLPDYKDRDAINHALDILPADVVSHRALSWDGIRVEVIQSVTHDRVEFRFRAPCHLLLVYEEGLRDEGETRVGDLPPSSLRNLRRKLSFVPAGHEYRDWQRPRVRSRIICFYFDPTKMPINLDAKPTAVSLPPRLFFENNVLWETAVKLGSAIDDGSESDRYSEALAVVVAHELLCIQGNIRCRAPRARGGLAVWQQRVVAAYIEEHLAEPKTVGELAKLVNLSSYHFCRAFKQSFGVPPHRYHINRRIERAKTLLATPAQSVTEIALTVGFSETSSFSAAFRNTTGTAPTEYRRALG